METKDVIDIPSSNESDESDVQYDNCHRIPETEPSSNLVDGLCVQSDSLDKDIAMNRTMLGHEEGEIQPLESHSLPGSPVEGLSGTERGRMAYEPQQPSVHVIYNSITRASKRKLEELLQQWSEWHALHDSASQEPAEATESGEEIYFPALHTGSSSAVSFWMDSQQVKEQDRGLITSDAKSVPLYDRGYAKGLISSDGSTNLEGGLQLFDDPARCFNCGSYSHSLKECSKPRDNVAVKNAREQMKSKRNQSAGSRNPTRYYQNTPGGKYDGLRPGGLDRETQKVLGIGELDPPPWLNRMREIGYPPGYLDVDDEDQPSGIIIYDGEMMEKQEDGEILEAGSPNKKLKKMVEFPGVNAPIPENANKRRWEMGSSTLDSSRDHSHRIFNHPLDSSSRGQQGERHSRESRNEGPPGRDAVISPSAYSYPPRYGGYMSSQESHDYNRSSYDTRSRSPLRYDEFVSHDYVRSLSPGRYSQHSHYESARHGNQLEERRDQHNRDYREYRHDRRW